MCGIVGIINSENVAEEIFVGLLNLQHRGQNSSGILTYDNNFFVHKSTGLVDRIYSEDVIQRLPGTMGIGHTRYPTIGASQETQPFYVPYPYGIAMVHNGNIINYQVLKEYLHHDKHHLMTTENDLEILLNIFADRIGHDELSVELMYEGIRDIYQQVIGGYAVVGLIAGEGIIGFKDPKGIRPLLFLEREQDGKLSYAFASEDVALSSIGFKVIRDVRAGEMIFVDRDMNVHEKVLDFNVPAPCMFEWVYFARAESVIDDVGVYTARLRLGKELAKLLKQHPVDVVAPVPDTSRTAAIALAEELDVPYREVLIKNRYIGRTFIMSSQTERENAVTMKLNLVRSEIEGKNIAIVDDSIVRGTTSRQIVHMLREAGARKVYFVSTCPPIKHACYYGIDFPDNNELIASNKSIKQIKQELQADELIYLDLKSLKKMTNSAMCTACLNGTYPTPLFAADEFTAQRKKDRV